MGDRILVVDDDPDILQYVKTNLEREGFETETASNGVDALVLASENPPSLVLLDVMMPEMDGLTTLRHLRNDPPTASVPVVMLTARALAQDRVKGLDLGADDYITKPFAVEELIARVRTVIRRAQQMRDVSPLTGLPGNFRISAELEQRISEKGPIAVVYGDLDNFKSFNDHYGFMRGDTVIKFTGKVMVDAAAACGGNDAFVGHVGGDDYIAVIDPDHVDEYCSTVIQEFDDGILDFYDTVDAVQGYIEVTDRRGERHAFPLVSFSMGVVTNQDRAIASEWEASAIASEMKEFAKRQPGSTYSVDRRQ
ncbi:MAG: response regulator [Actinomycetota bacterium]|nr:response regulator [Actinomycetota bacterium]